MPQREPVRIVRIHRGGHLASTLARLQGVIENSNGTQSAGPRPYAGSGDIQWMENRVLSKTDPSSVIGIDEVEA
jgi:hypothetical protein